MRRAEHRRERRRRFALWAGVTALAGAVVGGLVLLGLHAKRSSPSDAPIASLQTFAPDRGHVKTPVNYPQTPPAGGPHSPLWLTCGVYRQPVPNENAVHSMEHGAAWLTYRPDLPTSEVSALASLVREQGTYLLLSPYPNLPAPIVASAWGAQIRLDSTADPRLRQFVTRYRQSPKAPEPGATCDGGIGTPAA